MSHDELCLVLRDVPLDLSEGEIIGALGVHCARRFVRTASRPPRPLRLVRVECRDGAQRAALLSDGSVVLRGVCCPIETPKCTSQSAAAVGRTVLTPEALQKMLSAVGAASALYPEDNSLRSPIPGEIVFCRHGRFHRGYHAVVRDVIDRGRSFAIAREGKQQRQQQPQQQRQQQQQQQQQEIPRDPAALVSTLPASDLVPVLSSAQQLWREALHRAALHRRGLSSAASSTSPHPEQLAASLETGCGDALLVVCAETDMYRRLARAEAFAGDRCLEIGSGLGPTPPAAPPLH